jgi:putative membrane protein
MNAACLLKELKHASSVGLHKRFSELKDNKMLGRRSLLVGLATVVFLPAAEAQEASAIDNDLVRQTRAISALSLLASREGIARLNIPRIKAFANSETVEQETTWAVLRFLADGTSENNSAPPSNSELEQYLVPLAQQMLQTLRKTDGTGFAREYFLLEVNVHQQLLRIQEDYLRVGTNKNYISICRLLDVLVREHLIYLDDIKNNVDAGKGTGAPVR